MPAEAVKTSLRELKRLRKMPQQMPEHAMLRYDYNTTSDVNYQLTFKQVIIYEYRLSGAE